MVTLKQPHPQSLASLPSPSLLNGIIASITETNLDDSVGLVRSLSDYRLLLNQYPNLPPSDIARLSRAIQPVLTRTAERCEQRWAETSFQRSRFESVDVPRNERERMWGRDRVVGVGEREKVGVEGEARGIEGQKLSVREELSHITRRRPYRHHHHHTCSPSTSNPTHPGTIATTTDAITRNLLTLSSTLKHNAYLFSSKLAADAQVLGTASSQLDTNMVSLKRQQGRLKKFMKEARAFGLGTMVVLVLAVFTVFVLGYVVVKLF